MHGHTTERLLYANMKKRLSSFEAVMDYTEGLEPAADVDSVIESSGHSFWNSLKPYHHKCRYAIESLGRLGCSAVSALACCDPPGIG